MRRLLIALLIAVGVGAGAALASTAFTTQTGSAVTSVRILTGNTNTGADGADTISQTFATMPNGCCDNVPWAFTKMTVPSGQQAFFIVTLVTSGWCNNGGNGAGECLVQLTVNGNPNESPTPAIGAAATLNVGTEESHTVTLTSNTLPAGTYTLAVQWATSDPNTEFFIDANKVIFERVRV